MQDKLTGIYSIVLGAAVLGLWATILSGGPLAEGRTELTFHLASEILMALACITAGILLLRGGASARPATAAAHAMVIYSTLNAAGYYAQRGEPAVALAMVALSLVSAAVVVTRIARP